MIRQLVNRIIFDVVNQGDLDRANEAVDEAADNANEAARATDRQSRSVRGLGRVLQATTGFLGRFSRGVLGVGRRVATFGGIVGGVGAAGIIALGRNALLSAGDVEESVDRMQVAFGSIADSAETQLRRTSAILGVNRNQFRDFVTDFALQLQGSVGIERAAGLAQQLTERAFDVGSFQNTEAADVFAAFRAGINGSSEPLDRFNVNIRASVVDQFALTNGLARNRAEIDENIRRFARLQLILQQTANAQGNLALTANSFTNLSRSIRAGIQEIVADIGAEFIPTAVRFLQRINMIIRDNRDTIVEFFADVADSVESFIQDGGLESIAQAFGRIADFAVMAAQEVNRFFNLTDRERDIDAIERQITEGNDPFLDDLRRNQFDAEPDAPTIREQIRAEAIRRLELRNITEPTNSFPPRAETSTASLPTASNFVTRITPSSIARNAVSNNNNSVSQTVNVTVNGGNTDSRSLRNITRAVESGVNRGNRGTAIPDTSVNSGVSR